MGALIPAELSEDNQNVINLDV